MLIDQADLFDGMDRMFIQEFMSNTIKQKFNAGDIIFRNGDQADHFYTLIEGNIRIIFGESKTEVYQVTHPGEAFGWSSLVDRNYYSASAECLTATYLHKIERVKLEKLLEKYPEKSGTFYKRIAGMLGHRLVECYRRM
jgi:CRP-like cAMP-binding protein